MRKILLALVLMIASCSHEKRHDTNTEVIQNSKKESIYLSSLYSMRDEYGLLLPKEDGVYKDQGDALLWNSIAIASICYLGTHESLSMLDSLWTSYKSLQDASGRLFRHPSLKDGVTTTSISKDGVIGFIFLGAVVKETKCAVEADYVVMLQKFVNFIKVNNYEMGIGKTDVSVTYLADRHLLRSVMKLYGIDTELDYKTSIHNLSIPSESAPYIITTKYNCKFVNDGLPYCPFVDELSVFPNHLTFLSVMISWIDWKYNQIPLHGFNDIKQYSESLARAGVDIGYSNHLFIIGREIISDDNDFMEALNFLRDAFPENLPSEAKGVFGWGCTDYIWQRLPKESCDGSAKVYLGLDFLLPYSMIKFYSEK